MVARRSVFWYLICMKTILLTGFEPFGGESINPAQKVLQCLPESIGGILLNKLLLPVEYGKSAVLLIEQIEALHPAAVVMLGQAGGRAKITPERIAINLDHSESADNSGECRINTMICPDAPAALFSTLSIDAMLQAMRTAGVECAMSVSAGAFVCNHVFFEALHHIARSGYNIPAGFIHLPYLPEQVQDKPGIASMPLQAMITGISAALEELVQAIRA